MRRFEAYARAARIPQEQLADALLLLLDDGAFRAFDLLGLTAAQITDYKELLGALTKRFAPDAGESELRFRLGQRSQQPTECLDEFADSLLDLANRAYPELETEVRMRLARDRFPAGVWEDYIQEHLLQTGPETLEEAWKDAKRLEAARTTRKQMQAAVKSAVNSIGHQSSEPTQEVAAVNQ